MNLIMHPA